MGMPKYEIGPSAKTADGVFVEASATRFSAEASARMTVWQSPSIPLPPNRRVPPEQQQPQPQRQRQRPSEGPGSGSWKGRETPLGKMRPVSRGGEPDGMSPIARSKSRQREVQSTGRGLSAGPGGGGGGAEEQQTVDGGGDPWDERALANSEESELQVFEYRKRKAAEEERKANFAREFAVARLQALLKFMEMGDSKALFKKMNKSGGNRRFVSRYQLESKPSTHGSPGAKRGAQNAATAVNSGMFAPGVERPHGAAAAVANALPAHHQHQPKRSITDAHESLLGEPYADFGPGEASTGEMSAASGGGGGAPIPTGALRVVISPQTEADLREVFTFYCQYGDRLNTSYLSNAKTAKLAKDIGIIPHLVPSAGMDIMYSRAAARDGVLGKLIFWEFCTLVEDIAEAVAPDEPLQEVFDEVASMIIERGQRMPLDDVVQQEKLMADPKLWNMLGEHELALDAIFDYYAHMYPESGSGDADERTELDQVVSFAEFHQFALDFNFFPQCMSKPALLRLFVNSNAGTAADEAADQMSFPEFLQSLVRISLHTDLRGRQPGEMSKFERYEGIPFALSSKAVEQRKREYPGLPEDPPVVVGFSHTEKMRQDATDNDELGCLAVGTAKKLMFSSGRSVQSASAAGARDRRGATSPPPHSPRLAAAAAAGVGSAGAHMRTDRHVQSSGYTYGVQVSPPRTPRPGTTPMTTRGSGRRRSPTRRSPTRGRGGGGDQQPRWQLGFKGTTPGKFPPPLGGGRPGTSSPVGGGPYSSEGLDGGFSYASSAYLPETSSMELEETAHLYPDRYFEEESFSGYQKNGGGVGGGFGGDHHSTTRRRAKPLPHPDHAESTEQRMAILHRVKSVRDESITRLSARRQEREGLQMASNQRLMEGRLERSRLASASASASRWSGSSSLMESAAQLSQFLDRPQTAGVNTSSRGLISASGSGTMPSPRAAASFSRPMAGRNRGAVKPAVRAMPLVPSSSKPTPRAAVVASALPTGHHHDRHHR